MMSKQRWPETNTKINKPVQKKGGKEAATLTLTAPVSSGGKQTGSSARSKSTASSGRSNSVGSRGGESTTGSKVGGSLKTSGAFGQQSSAGHRSTRPASRSARPAIRLSGSRSFSSLHTSSLTTAPFTRSSRSLNRLDQRDDSDHADTTSQVKKEQSAEKKGLDSVKLSSSLESFRDNKDQCHGDNAEKMKTSTTCQPPESSSSVVSTACHHHCNKVKKQELKRSSLPRYHWLKCLESRDAAIPDLLNFKKGWMMQQDANGQWQKQWFVLTDQILRFYKDSVAEEAADMDGEINLSTCFDIKDYPAQKNCGFQIHTRDGVYTLCAMTSGMRRNWVQAVLKNVRPAPTPGITSSPSEQNTQEQPDSPSADVLGKTDEPNNGLQELCKDGQHKITSCVENKTEQQDEREPILQPETEQLSAVGSSASSLSTPVSPSTSSAPSRMEEGEDTLCQQCPHVGTTETAGIPASTPASSVSECLDEHSNTQSEIEQSWQQDDNTHQTEEKQVSTNSGCECIKEEKLPHGEQTGQLVKELEKTQKELSRLQQLNNNLQDELQQEREMHSKVRQFDLHSSSTLTSEQVLSLRRLQKINHDLRSELEAQKRSQEEAREAELRRRVDLLAQQAQLLVTGDATALAQAHLEQDRRRFHEQQMEWERCVASLKSQLSISEELRTEAESRLTQLQQELQGYCKLQQEADKLRENFLEVTTQLRDYEDTQVQKEARLQKHLMLLQASQERERTSLATSLLQAEQHSHDLQERLDRAEQQVESLTKTQAWTREIEEAQQQLQDELAHTLSAVQRLQEEREQLDRRCQELQNQLSETDGEMSRLQNRLKTEETHYYNLEHSYERVCEELQLAVGKVQQRETETQDMREGYERLLDRKEQELSEVLLKMEVLGNSLEETEMKLNEVMKVSSSASERKQQITDSSAAVDVQNGDHDYEEHARTRSRSTDSSYQNIVTAGDDPEKFMSVIQLLETKLYVTEEKLRDITQRLEEHQSHVTCQDPHLCSQLTQSRATAQHLSLLLHSQAKHSQRFAQETENRCRMLVGRFQVSLNIVQACRDRLQSGNLIDIADFEMQLATVAACLQQGEVDAEKQKQESHSANKVGDRILNDWSLTETNLSVQSKLTPSEDDLESVGKCLLKELFVLEKMASVLQSQDATGKLSLGLKEDEGDVACRYKSIISQRIALKVQSGRRECDNTEPLERVLFRVCAEAELIYTAFKFQQQYENMSLADINPPELASYEEQVDVAGKPQDKDETDDKKVEAEEEPAWLEKLIARLQRRAKFLRQLSQEISDDNGPVGEDNWEKVSAADLGWMREQVKMIYLSHRLYLDLEQALKQSEEKLQAMCKEQDITLMGEQEAFNETLCQLQEDNSVLRDELERAEQKVISVETGNQKLLEDIHKIEDYHEERVQKLETEFQEKIRELQLIHEEEMKHLHGYYSKSCVSKEKQSKTGTEAPPFTENTSATPDHTGTEPSDRAVGGGADAYQDELDKSERFTVMEEMHQKLITDLQRQHQKEVAKLLTEKDQLLKEETAATLSAIVAMRRAHKEELEKSRRSQHIRESPDVAQLHVEYEKEIKLLHKELELLSVQHTQKCLENSQLSQELHDERQSLMQYQKENQDLKKTQRDADEIAYLHSSLNGTQSHVASQVNDFYEMEVILRAREAEMQFLRQEAVSLREELKLARMDKIYAQNKLKAFCTSSPDGPHHEANNVYEDVKFATWSPGRDASRQGQEDAVANQNDTAFLKKTDRKPLYRQIRGMRSKSLKEGLSVQERMRLFESF